MERPLALMGSVVNCSSEEFSGLLVDPQVRMFNDAFSNKLPQTLTEANISVLLKKGKCPESCASYRPISLLKVDRKILAKFWPHALKVSCLKLFKRIKLVS